MHYLTIAVFVAVIILMFYFYFKLKKLVMQDLMTGVKNRNAFEMYVNKLTQKTRIENDLWLIIYVWIILEKSTSGEDIVLEMHL